MSKIIDLRNKRNTLWEQTKNFLEENRDENGLVEASAVEQYEKMAADVKALGEEIQRLEDQMEMDAKLSAATSVPVHADPKAGQREMPVRPTATAKYSEAFWNMMRGINTMEVRDALSIGVDQNGGYTVPDEFERKLIQGLRRTTSSAGSRRPSTQTPAPARSRSQWTTEARPGSKRERPSRNPT